MSASGRLSLQVGVGGELIQFEVSVEAGELYRRSSVMLSGCVQYGWPHARGTHFYVVSSDGGPPGAGGRGGNHHLLSAFRIDPASGRLSLLAEPVRLRHRPIHVSTDIPSEHALVAYNDPSGLSVHRIRSDGSLGEEIAQPAVTDRGSYAHQIRVFPSNRKLVLVTRGHDAGSGHEEIPGALKVFDYQAGILDNEQSIAPGGGYGFGPRHLDFHPTRPWVYVSLERQNKLQMFRSDGDRIRPTPVLSRDTLAFPDNKRPRQMAGTVHVHPSGRFVYGAERSEHTEIEDGRPVFVGGENAILVFAIDPETGEPSLIQREPTRGLHPRTFSIDPSGRLLIAANKSPVPVRKDGAVREISAGLDMFRIGEDGRLAFIRTYEVDASKEPMFWSGLVRY